MSGSWGKELSLYLPDHGAFFVKHRFNINFDCGYGGDVAFTFDVRFQYGNDRNVLVRNNRQGGAWKNEERHAQYFPFTPNGYFEIMILVEGHCFKV